MFRRPRKVDLRQALCIIVLSMSECYVGIYTKDTLISFSHFLILTSVITDNTSVITDDISVTLITLE